MDNVHQARWIFWFVLLTATPVLRAGPADDQYQLAAHHYRHQRWELATAEFKTFLDRFSDDTRASDASFYLGEALVQQHQFDRARARFSDYLAAAPSGTHAGQALFRKGELAYLQDHYDLARPDLEAFHRRFPNDPLNTHCLYYLGEIALAADDPDSARDAFQACLKLRPEGTLGDDCRFGLAQAFERRGDVDGALRFYQFLADKPNAVQGAEAQLQLAIILYHEGRFGDAIDALRQLKDRAGDRKYAPEAWYWLGMSQLASGQWEPAAKTLTEAAERFKSHSLAPAMQFAAAEALRLAGAVESARTGYENLVASWPTSRWADDGLQILVRLAWDDKRLDDVDRLARQFQDQFPASPLRWIVQQTAGRALLKQERFDAALNVFQTLTRERSEPDDTPRLAGGKETPATANADDALQTADAAALETRAAPVNWYYLALAQLGANRLEDALQSLDHVGAVKQPAPLVSGIRVARAAALVGLKRFEAAITPLEQYLATDPNGLDAAKCRAQLAVAYAKTGQWLHAERAVARMEHDTPLTALYYETVQFVAEAAYEQKQTQMAGAMFRRLTRDDTPPDYRARGFSGLAWLQWDQDPGSAAASAAFAKLLERFPHHKLAAEAAMMRGRALAKQGKPEAALAMYDLVIKEFPESEHAPNAALTAAKIHAQLEQNHEAEAVLRDLMKEHPKYHPDAVVYQLAWVLVDLNQPEQADRLFARLHDDMPKSSYWPDATYRLAERAARAKQVQRADHLAAELIEANAGKQMVPYAFYLRGQIAATEQRWKDVQHWMQRLVESFPHSTLVPAARYWLAEAHYRLQQFAAAGSLFDQLANDQAVRGQPWMAMVALRRAQVRAQQDDWDAAYEIAKTVHTQFPKFDRQYEVDYVLGRYHASRADFDKARAAYQRVIDSSTGAKTETAAMAQWMIGETYFLQKQYDQAIKAYYRVEGLYDYPQWQAAALLQAGKCHEMVGRWSDAISVYTQVISDYQDTQFARKATNRLRVARQRAGIAQR